MFCSPLSIAITSLREESANRCAFRMFVQLALVWFCRFLGVREGLLLVIVALPGLFPLSFFFWLLCFSLICGVCTICQHIIALPFGVIGRLCSVIIALPGNLLSYFCYKINVQTIALENKVHITD